MKIKNLYIQRGIQNNRFVRAFKNKHPGLNAVLFNDLDEVKSKGEISFFIKDTLVLARQKSRFIMDCPCSKQQVSCGYVVVDWGAGCLYKCGYCYLNYYQNVPGILVYANLDDCFRELDVFLQNNTKAVRIGTGEFIDSLALEAVFPTAKYFIEYFADKKPAVLELKTKSAEVSGILGLKHNGNTVVSWSLNPEKIIEENEFFTASLSGRLKAAKSAAAAGYKLAFHFDPLIYYNGWENGYKQAVDKLFKAVSPDSIEWISLGALRFNHKLFGIHEKYYKSKILYEGEFIHAPDGKYRYFRPVRREMFKRMIDFLTAHISPKKIYLCMESPQLWKDLTRILQ